jgi:hypothetical protein
VKSAHLQEPSVESNKTYGVAKFNLACLAELQPLKLACATANTELKSVIYCSLAKLTAEFVKTASATPSEIKVPQTVLKGKRGVWNNFFPLG